VLPEEGVDYVVGFGIGMRGNGEPSLLSRAVACRCLEIYKSGKCRKIIFTGGNSENNISEAEAMKRVALEQGVPEDKIFIENLSRNTRENSINTLKLLTRLDPKSLSIGTVGHFLHARRCYNAFKKVAPQDWQVFCLKTYSPWDPKCTQKRLHSEWRFIFWEIPMFTLFKLLRWA